MRKKTPLVTIIFLLIFIAAIFIGWQLFGPTINAQEGNFIYIKTGATYQNVKDDLTKKNIVYHIGIFDRVARYLNYTKFVKPGKYKITQGMSLVSLVRMLRSGNQSAVNLIITKLRTKEDFAKKISANFEPDSATVSLFINNPDSISKFNIDTNTVLSAIIPDTYTFTWNTSISKIFTRLYSAQQKFWNTQREAQAEALGLNKTEVYILASIVEEETNKQQDKGNIASVYLNRMRSGMRLAADPTVKFALKDFSLKRIYFKHLSVASPYNTYLVSGLPPGPICTPSIKTIDAVLTQPATNYLYFVAKPDFSQYSNFATSYEEHKRNAKAYQHALDSLILSKQKSANIKM